VKQFADATARAIAAALVLAAFAFLLLPLLVAITMSFDARPYLGPFPPQELSLRWYREFFSNGYYLKGLWISLTISMLAAAVAMLIGISMAVFVDRSNFRGKTVLVNLFLAPLIIPAVVVGFALLIFLSKVGIFDGYWRLLAGHVLVAMPYTFRTTLVGLNGIPKVYVEAAQSLGATENQAFWDVTLPLSRTGITAGVVFALAFSMDDASLSMFLSDPQSYTLPVAMLSMMRANFDLTTAAAAVVLVLLTLGLIFLLDRLVGLERVIGQGMYRG
jgi:putative spermidine/putrescine transport system permease protein